MELRPKIALTTNLENERQSSEAIFIMSFTRSNTVAKLCQHQSEQTNSTGSIVDSKEMAKLFRVYAIAHP